ncbi:MAG: hypothetical protein M3M95_06135, partial [Pseudomonadota bacterium]|nr:hypothetical protein [Pseudomonadota bacterium]
MMAMGRPKGLGRAPVSMSALPFEEKRNPFAALSRFKPGRRTAAAAAPTARPQPRRPGGTPTVAATPAPAPTPQASSPILAPAPALSLAASELEASMA